MNVLQLIRAAVEPTRSERPLFLVFSETLEALHKQPLVFRTKHCVFRVHTRSDYDAELGTLNDFRIVVNHNTDLPVEYAVEFHDSNINRTGVDEILIFNKTRKSFAPMRIPEARTPQDLLARCLRAILNYYGDTGPDRVSRATHAAAEPTRSWSLGNDFIKLVQTFNKPEPAPVKFKGVDFVVTSHRSHLRLPEDRTITVAVKSGTVDSVDYYVTQQGYRDPALNECVNIRHGHRSGPGPIAHNITASNGPSDLLKQILSYAHDNEQRHAEAGVHASAEPPTYNHIKTVFERLLRIFPTSMEGEGYKHVTPDIVGWREHNTDMFLAVLADRKAPKATLHLYSTAPGYAVEVSTGPLHSDPVLDITSATTPADMLKQALAFYRNHLKSNHIKSKHVQAAVEPGSEITGTERGFRGAAQLILSKATTEGSSNPRLRRVAVGSRTVDISVAESTATIFNARNLIPLIIEVVYSDVTAVNTWNQLRRTFTYNSKTGTVNMGKVVVPGSPDPAKMLKSMLSTYVKHVNLFAHGAAEPETDPQESDLVRLYTAWALPIGSGAVKQLQHAGHTFTVFKPRRARAQAHDDCVTLRHGDRVFYALLFNFGVHTRVDVVDAASQGLRQRIRIKHAASTSDLQDRILDAILKQAALVHGAAEPQVL